MNLQDIQDLAWIADCRGRKVYWQPEADPAGEPLIVTVRNFVPDEPYFLGSTEDVETAYLWLTGTVEYFPTVREILAARRSGRFQRVTE